MREKLKHNETFDQGCQLLRYRLLSPKRRDLIISKMGMCVFPDTQPQFAKLSSYSFDAWILKPIDFGRLDFILQGIKYPELKRHALYTPGHWERGGWFLS